MIIFQQQHIDKIVEAIKQAFGVDGTPKQVEQESPKLKPHDTSIESRRERTIARSSFYRPENFDIDEAKCDVKGDIVDARGGLCNHSKKVKEVSHDNNLFHTRCHIQEKVCSMIIDESMCNNLASTYMVEKLGLPLVIHPQPYMLQGLNGSSEFIKVDKQVLISFKIGKYDDEVLCDVVDLHAAHLLLGRPWQLDRKVKRNSIANKYSFVHKNRAIRLVPMTAEQVYDDQLRLKKKRDEKKEREKKEGEAKKIEREEMKNDLDSEVRSETLERNSSEKESELLRGMFLKDKMIEAFQSTKDIEYFLPSFVFFLLKEFQGEVMEHFGIKKTLTILHKKFDWPHKKRDVEMTCAEYVLPNHVSLSWVLSFPKTKRCHDLTSNHFQEEKNDVNLSNNKRVADMRTNQFKEEGNDVNLIKTTSRNPIFAPIESIKNIRKTKIKDKPNLSIQDVCAQENRVTHIDGCPNASPKSINLIQFQSHNK